jgi:hypothetical protein
LGSTLQQARKAFDWFDQTTYRHKFLLCAWVSLWQLFPAYLGWVDGRRLTKIATEIFYQDIFGIIFVDCILCAPLVLIQQTSKMVVVMHRIINVKVLNNFRVELKYDDGRQGIADLSHLAGKGVFALWNDYDAFRNVAIGWSGELVWNNLIDLCPDSLYLKITNQRPEDLS